MNKVFAYVRVSTVKQGERGVSLQEQRDAITRYCARESLEIVQWFEERQTAAKRGRPVFAQMLKLLSRGKAAGIVIHKIDRGARNLRDWASLGDLIDLGVKVHFVNESLDLHTRGGRLSADIQAVVAADYIRNLREETRKGFYGRLKQGLFPLPAPTGYRDNGGGKAKTLDSKTAPLVKKAFEIYATGRYTLDSLLPELYRLGLRNHRGGFLSRTGLAQMLHNPFYTGLIQLSSTRETFAGVHEPLIGRYLFDRVQDLLAGKAKVQVQRHDFVYRQRIKCCLCGYRLIGEVQKGHTYYRCHTRDCPTKGIREEALDVAIIAAFRAMEFTDMERRHLAKLLAEHQASWDQQRTELAKSLDLRQEQVTARLARLTDAYLDEAIDREMFEERKALLLAERLEIEASKRTLDTPVGHVLNRVQEILERANMASLLFIQASHENKRHLLATVTSNLALERKNLAIALYSPFDIIAKRHEIAYGGPKRTSPRTLEVLLAAVVKHCRTTDEQKDTSSENGPVQAV